MLWHAPSCKHPWHATTSQPWLLLLLLGAPWQPNTQPAHMARSKLLLLLLCRCCRISCCGCCQPAHLLKVAHGLAHHLGRQVEVACQHIFLHPLLLSQCSQQHNGQPAGVLLQRQRCTESRREVHVCRWVGGAGQHRRKRRPLGLSTAVNGTSCPLLHPPPTTNKARCSKRPQLPAWSVCSCSTAGTSCSCKLTKLITCALRLASRASWLAFFSSNMAISASAGFSGFLGSAASTHQAGGHWPL